MRRLARAIFLVVLVALWVVVVCAAFEATDWLSGVASVEVSIDGGDYMAFTEPLRLPRGAHEFRCRAADRAGNQDRTLTGGVLTGGETGVLRVTVR